ncbi:MAG: acyl-CoA dehydrogenase [Pseudomonadota bacterium]
MSNLLVNPRDQLFILYEQLGIEKLFEHEKFQDFSRQIVDISIKEAEKFAVKEILPTYMPGDREGVKFENGVVKAPACFHAPYRMFCENEWLKAAEDPEIGGQGMPRVVWAACSEYFLAANFSFLIYPGLTWGAAGLVHKYGTEKQKEKYMGRMYDGEWGGTMCLTEPGAGSDVGAVKTKAVRLPDGTFSLTGTKIFISSGDHDLTENIVHPVLARIEGDPQGTDGISLFLVPKIKVGDDGTLGESNDVVVGNIEHKMGIKGSATCTLNFGESGSCVGELLGEERKGMKIMFSMMNEARMEVGMQALGYASAAYENAVQYARERLQGKYLWEMRDPNAKSIPIIRHPDVRRMLLWMKAHVEGIRAMNYFVACCQDRSEIAGNDDEKQKWLGFVELLTPVLKAYCSDKAVEICSMGIDVYGGYGYCQDYPMEQYLRDAKIACLYEGTNGIQALDLVGRKMGRKKGADFMGLLVEVAGTIDRAGKHAELKPYVKHLEEAHMAVMLLAQKFATWQNLANFLVPIINARPFLMILGDFVLGWQLMDAAQTAAKQLDRIYGEAGAATKGEKRDVVRKKADAAFYVGKIASAKYFAVNVLAQVRARCKSIELADMTPLEIPEESFGD